MPIADPHPAFDEAGSALNVDPMMLRAIAQVESGGAKNPDQAVSSAGALGRMQVMPANLKHYNVTDWTDPRQNIHAGAALFDEALTAANGNVPMALRIYQGGPDQSKWGQNNAAYPGKVAAAYQALTKATPAETPARTPAAIPAATPAVTPSSAPDATDAFLSGAAPANGAERAAPAPDATDAFLAGTPASASQAGAQTAASPATGGIARNAAAGMLDASGNLLNTVANPAGNLIGKPLATAGVFLHDLIAPHVGGQRFPDDVRNMLLGDTVPQPGSALISGIGNALGANPANVSASTQMERLTRAGVGGAATAALMGPSGVAAPVVGAAGGVGGLLARQAAPEWAKPAAELAGNIVGGGLALPALAGANMLRGAVNRFGAGPAEINAAGAMPGGGPPPMPQPAGGPVPGAPVPRGMAAPKGVPQTAAEAKSIAGAYYDKADQAGGTLTPDFANKFIDAAQRIAPQSPAGLAVAGETPVTALAGRLEALRNQPITLKGAQEIDESLSGLIDKEYGMKGLSKDGKSLFDLQSDFRNMIQNAGPVDISGGTGGFDALAQGRKAWSQAMKMDDLERIQQRAMGTDNPATGIKSGIRTLLNNRSRVRGYSDDEISALQQAQDRGVLGGALHVFGSRLIPQAAAVGGFFAGGGLAGSLAAGGAAHYAGSALRAGATALQSNRLANAMGTLAKGVPPNLLNP